MKQLLFSIFLSSAILNCSTHPEIKPYDNAENNSLDLNEEKKPLLSDSIFNNDTLALDDEYYDDSETPTEFDDRIDMVGQSTDLQAPVEKKNIKVHSPQRSVASTSQNGFYRFTKDCEMKSSPEEAATDAGHIPHGKRLWLDVHNAQWFKAYKKSGTVYVSTHCVQPN